MARGSKAANVRIVAHEVLAIDPERVYGADSFGDWCQAVAKSDHVCLMRNGHVARGAVGDQLPHGLFERVRGDIESRVRDIQASGAKGRGLEAWREGVRDRVPEQHQPRGPQRARSAATRSMTLRTAASSSSAVVRYVSRSPPNGSLIGRSSAPCEAYEESKNVLPAPPMPSIWSRWCGPIARIRSWDSTSAGVMVRERCSLRSSWRSRPTSSAPSDAG